MADEQRTLTPSAIKYLLALLDLCQNDAGARCMDIAEQLRVKKPSVHSMIENLCAAGLAEKKKYGTVFLTPEGRAQAERYAACCSLLRGRMQQTLGLNEADARRADQATGTCRSRGRGARAKATAERSRSARRRSTKARKPSAGRCARATRQSPPSVRRALRAKAPRRCSVPA